MMSMFSQVCILLQWKAISATNLALTTTTSFSRRQTTGCNKWRRTNNLGMPKGRNTNFHSIVSPAKDVKKKNSTHQERQLATVCDDVFHRNFSSAGGTD
jgi:hypothetical protein